ncbi:sphingoid long chain base kinase 4 [Trichomonascus vanleenenianus]|uniref:sphingoid long chain base kinase 4 n=1 Tax=Trichomonascus vanleenenianus TaxID=2268995 RepID=UPI003EC9D7A1
MPSHILDAKVTHSGLTLEGATKHSRSACVPTGSAGPEKIPFKNVLWIDKLESEHDRDGASVFELAYAKQGKAFHYTPKIVHVTIHHGHTNEDENVEARILDEAYQDAKPQKRLLILINPHGGQGKAEAIYRKHCAPMLAAARCKPTVIKTTHRYHAQEIAEALKIEDYDAIVCCSGDGIPHEVINGFARRNDGLGARALKEIPICQLPCGSGNSMAVSLNGTPSPDEATLNIIKGKPMPIDLMNLSQGDKHRTLSFLSQTYGVVADADLGTESMRWMGGTRFIVGTLQRIMARTAYPCEVYIKYAREAKQDVDKHYKTESRRFEEESRSGKLVNESSPVASAASSSARPGEELVAVRYGTVKDPIPEDWTKIDSPKLAMFYVGKMPWVSADALMFPATLPCDGMLDLVMFDNTLGRMKSLDLLTKVEHGEHFHLDSVQYSKIEAYRLVPKIPSGYLSIDGESFPFEPFQVEVLKGAGCLLSATGTYAPTNLHHCHANNR